MADEQDWVKTMLAARRCNLCEGELTDAAVAGLSLAWREKAEENWMLGAMVQVIVQCPSCYDMQSIPAYPSKAQLLATADELYLRYWSPAIDAEAHHFSLQQHRNARMSFKKPFSKAELRRFAKQLEQTDFKRDSEGFREWLRRMGIDPDPPAQEPD